MSTEPIGGVAPELVPGAVSSRMATAAGVAGLVFAALFTVALILLRTGQPPADEAAFAAWWQEHGSRIELGTYLIPFVGIAFIWFVAAVRLRIGRAEGLFFSSVFLSSALLFAGTLFVVGAAAGAIVYAAGEDLDRARAAALAGYPLGHALFFGFTLKMAGMFMLVVSTIGRAARTLPPWLLLITVLLGLSLLIGNLFIEVVALVFPAWVAVISGVLLWLDRQRAASPG